MASQGRSIELPLRSWTTFYHPRFHYELPIPPGVRAQGDPEAGVVATFISHDHQFAISAWSRHAPGSRAAQLEGEWRSALNKNGRMVTYQRKAASWFVVSGTDSTGVEFYEKSMVRGDQLSGFKLTYLHSLVSVFDPWVEKIEAGYVLESNPRSAASFIPSGI